MASFPAGQSVWQKERNEAEIIGEINNNGGEYWIAIFLDLILSLTFSSALLERISLAIKLEVWAKDWVCSETRWQPESLEHFSPMWRGIFIFLSGEWVGIGLCRKIMQKVAGNEGSESCWHFFSCVSDRKTELFNYSRIQLCELLVQNIIKDLYEMLCPCGWVQSQERILRIDRTWIKTVLGEDAL